MTFTTSFENYLRAVGSTMTEWHPTLLEQCNPLFVLPLLHPPLRPTGLYPSLAKAGTSLVSVLEDLIPLFQSLGSAWPLLPIHFFKLVAVLKGTKLREMVPATGEGTGTANQELVVMVTRMLQIEHLVSACSLCSTCVVE